MTRSEFEERLAKILSIGEDDEEYKQMTKCLGDMGLTKSFIVKDGAYHFCWEQNDKNVGFAVKTPDCAPDEEIDKDYFEKFLAVLTNAHEQAKTVDFQASLSDLVPTNVDDEDDDDDYDDDLSELDIEDEEPRIRRERRRNTMMLNSMMMRNTTKLKRLSLKAAKTGSTKSQTV